MDKNTVGNIWEILDPNISCIQRKKVLYGANLVQFNVLRLFGEFLEKGVQTGGYDFLTM